MAERLKHHYDEGAYDGSIIARREAYRRGLTHGRKIEQLRTQGKIKIDYWSCASLGIFFISVGIYLGALLTNGTWSWS